MAVENPFNLDTDAYLADTTNLSTFEHGAYLLILMTLWRSKTGWIDGSDLCLSRTSRMTMDKWKRISATIRALLISDDKGKKVSQKRLLKERARIPAGILAGGVKPLKNNAPISEMPNPARNPPAPPLLLTEEVKKEESPKKKSKGSVIPENWTPRASERDYGRSRGLTDAEIDQAAEQMRRWGIANAHREVARKSNWDMTFRNWLDGFVERKAKHGGASHEANRGNNSRRSFAGYAAELRYRATAGTATEDKAGRDEPAHGHRDTAPRLV